MKMFMRLFIASFILLMTAGKANATHIFGADLYYTHLTGNTYKITLTVYGDCSGSAFNNLYSAVPQIEVYNNTTLYQTLNLSTISSGVEVTPVCASQINNTTCNGGTVPGVKQFIFSGNVTLNASSSNWRFRFNGSFGGQNQAGRSTTITNITVSAASPSLMALEATLNNTAVANSAPAYTTIPTPFFCINVPAQYNPGAVDPDNDSLAFSLTAGLTPTGTVAYLAGYSAAAPLATAAGTFSMSATTGQLNFTPNLVQKSLVVNKVEEYHNGVLVGTSMREMVFVVLNNCNNNPPTGTMSTASGGSLSNNILTVCQAQGAFSFNINPTDPDGNSITVSIAGLPAWITANITNNGTTTPVVSFSCNTTNVALGSYNFYMTFLDDGCPLSSKQTVAYTINVVPNPTFVYTQLQPATCVKKAVFSVTPSGTPAPYVLTVLQGTSTVHTISNITGTQLDSLSPGTYTIRITNGNGCPKDSSVTINVPPVVGVNVTSLVNPTCNASNGSITIAGSGGLPPYNYAVGSGVYSSSGAFTGLPAGTYTLHVRDSNYCIKDTTVSLQTINYIVPSAVVQKSTCATLNNGQVTLSAGNGVAPYSYAVGSGAYGSSGTFTGLAAGTYTFHIKDVNNCIKDTIITITDSLTITTSSVITQPLCNGQNNGSVTITGNGGTTPYLYAAGTASYTSVNSFTGLAAGNYTLHVKDNNGCIKDTTVIVNQPTSVAASAVINQPSCNGGSNGSIILTGSGGTPAYTYAYGTNSFTGSNTFTGLSAGIYAVHIRDNNGCVKDTSLTVTQPAILTVTCAVANVKCYGESSGSVVVNAGGGTPVYTYAADGGAFQSVNLLSGLNAGTHIVTIKDSHGCLKDTTVTITQPQPLVIDSFIKLQPTCEGFTDGAVTIVAHGGTSPYQFANASGVYGNNASFTQLGAGTYTFNVKDNNGCIATSTVTLTGYPIINIDSVEITAVKCFGSADGLMTVFASGGVPLLSYTMTNAAGNGPTFTGLKSADYTVRIKDSKNCFKDTTVFIPTPTALSVAIDTINNDCEGLDNNGALIVMATGGTQPYGYTWSIAGAPDSAHLTGLPNGSYTVIVTDANSCTDSASASIVYDCCNVFIPNAFTPNKDGRNDEFRISYKGNLKLEQMLVYNRFGQLVYSSYGNIEHGWDGVFNGQPQDLGTYFYYIKVICGEVNPKEKIFKGDVILIR